MLSTFGSNTKIALARELLQQRNSAKETLKQAQEKLHSLDETIEESAEEWELLLTNKYFADAIDKQLIKKKLLDIRLQFIEVRKIVGKISDKVELVLKNSANLYDPMTKEEDVEVAIEATKQILREEEELNQLFLKEFAEVHKVVKTSIRACVNLELPIKTRQIDESRIKAIIEAQAKSLQKDRDIEQFLSAPHTMNRSSVKATLRAYET